MTGADSPLSPSKQATVHVYLLDEGTDTWRPTQAEDLGKGRYRLLPTPHYDPTDEHWEFLPGAIVECRLRALSGGRVLVAHVEVPDADPTTLTSPKRDGQVYGG